MDGTPKIITYEELLEENLRLQGIIKRVKISIGDKRKSFKHAWQ